MGLAIHICHPPKEACSKTKVLFALEDLRAHVSFQRALTKQPRSRQPRVCPLSCLLQKGHCRFQRGAVCLLLGKHEWALDPGRIVLSLENDCLV